MVKEKIKDKESIIYFPMYDYEEPKILNGFSTVIYPQKYRQNSYNENLVVSSYDFYLLWIREKQKV